LVWRHQQRASDASNGKHFPATPENFTDEEGAGNFFFFFVPARRIWVVLILDPKTIGISTNLFDQASNFLRYVNHP
jgi:hypothetical protein